MMRWTISDIAREAKVSKTTVSRVLNGRPDVDEETSARVRALIANVGYVRSARAMQLAHGRANAIGVLAPFDTSPWMIEVLRGVMAKVQETSFSLSLHAVPKSEADAARFANQLQSGAVDALLVVSLREPIEAVTSAAADGLPVVMLFDHGANGGIADVVPDEVVGIGAAVRHLAEVGRRRFALIAGPASNPVSRPRLEAFRAGLAAHGLDFDRRLVVEADFTAATAERAVAELLDGGTPFDAVFASSDAMAVGALRSIKRRGLSIPGDVSVVGFDDFSSAEFTEPRLTTVHNPLYEMATRAVTRLLAAIESGEPVSAIEDVVRTSLIIRDSSDPRRPDGTSG